MPELRITEVDTRRDLEALLRFPIQVYRQDPHWVPPLRAWLRRRLSKRNPFFEDASLKLWIARRGSQVVGTISALRDQRHEQLRGEPTAFFGFFESLDDPAIARALLGTASRQAHRWGASLLRGPRNLSRVEEVGVLVQGFDSAPPMLAGHHPPYYQRLLEDEGFTLHHDVLAYDTPTMDERGQPRRLPPKLESQAAAVHIPGLEVRDASRRALNRDLGLAHQVFVEAFRDVPENTPMPRRQFVNLGSAFLFFTDGRMLQLATVHGRAAGFALCFPELNEAVRHARGALLPAGWLRFLRATRHIHTASFKLIGVLPEYRSSGLHALMIKRAVDGVQRAGYTRLEASLVDVRNRRMRRVIEGAGLEIYRRYRIYQRATS